MYVHYNLIFPLPDSVNVLICLFVSLAMLCFDFLNHASLFTLTRYSLLGGKVTLPIWRPLIVLLRWTSQVSQIKKLMPRRKCKILWRIRKCDSLMKTNCDVQKNTTKYNNNIILLTHTSKRLDRTSGSNVVIAYRSSSDSWLCIGWYSTKWRLLKYTAHNKICTES